MRRCGVARNGPITMPRAVTAKKYPPRSKRGECPQKKIKGEAEGHSPSFSAGSAGRGMASSTMIRLSFFTPVFGVDGGEEHPQLSGPSSSGAGSRWPQGFAHQRPPVLQLHASKVQAAVELPRTSPAAALFDHPLERPGTASRQDRHRHPSVSTKRKKARAQCARFQGLVGADTAARPGGLTPLAPPGPRGRQYVVRRSQNRPRGVEELRIPSYLKLFRHLDLTPFLQSQCTRKECPIKRTLRRCAKIDIMNSRISAH